MTEEFDPKQAYGGDYKIREPYSKLVHAELIDLATKDINEFIPQEYHRRVSMWSIYPRDRGPWSSTTLPDDFTDDDDTVWGVRWKYTPEET